MKPIRWSSLMSFYDVRSRVLLSATFCKRSANSKLKRTYDKVEVIKDEANEFKLVLEHIQNEFSTRNFGQRPANFGLHSQSW